MARVPVTDAAPPEPPAPIPVIFDTDIGDDIDDTWALVMLLRSPRLDVRMITTDYGNTVYRAKLVARLLEIAGRTDIPDRDRHTGERERGPPGGVGGRLRPLVIRGRGARGRCPGPHRHRDGLQGAPHPDRGGAAPEPRRRPPAGAPDCWKADARRHVRQYPPGLRRRPRARCRVERPGQRGSRPIRSLRPVGRRHLDAPRHLRSRAAQGRALCPGPRLEGSAAAGADGELPRLVSAHRVVQGRPGAGQGEELHALRHGGGLPGRGAGPGGRRDSRGAGHRRREDGPRRRGPRPRVGHWMDESRALRGAAHRPSPRQHPLTSDAPLSRPRGRRAE